LEGIVTAADTRAPLAFAFVTTAGGRHTTTDNDGRFRLCEVSPGEVTVVVVATLYDSAVANVALAPGETAHVNLVLERDTALPATILLRPVSSVPRHVSTPVYFLDGERVVIDTSACARPPLGVRLVTEVPGDLEAIYVLRGDDAVAQYGAGARDGVVVITTRGGRGP
jgi:hypothetical protein